MKTVFGLRLFDFLTFSRIEVTISNSVQRIIKGSALSGRNPTNLFKSSKSLCFSRFYEILVWVTPPVSPTQNLTDLIF